MFALEIEDLHPVVLAVGDVHPVLVHPYVVGQVEVTFTNRDRTLLAPAELQLAVGREHVDPVVAIAVGHVHVPVRCDADVGRLVERLAVAAFLVLGPEGQQQLSIHREVLHGVVAVVRKPDRPVASEADAVGTLEVALAPGPQHVSVAVEHDHRVF